MNAMVFKFDSLADVKAAVENKDINISIEVYNRIKKAFYSKVKRKKVVAFSIQLNGNIVDFELGRDQWKKSLTTCMGVFAEKDMFEECIEIQKMLKEL